MCIRDRCVCVCVCVVVVVVIVVVVVVERVFKVADKGNEDKHTHTHL